MKKNLVNLDSNMVDFDICVSMMDDDIREQLHRELAPCTNQEFLDAYVDKHFEKYGEDFSI